MVSILMVCTGNICRSPMAEIVLREQLIRSLGDRAAQVQVRSAGVSSEEYGNPIDPRARRVLAAAGYTDGALSTHRARPIAADELDHTLILAMTTSHARAIRRFADRSDLAGVSGRVRMFRSFDPQAPQAMEFQDESLLDVADPWYGNEHDFVQCLAQIEGAMDQLVEFVREQLEAPGAPTDQPLAAS